MPLSQSATESRQQTTRPPSQTRAGQAGATPSTYTNQPSWPPHSLPAYLLTHTYLSASIILEARCMHMEACLLQARPKKKPCTHLLFFPFFSSLHMSLFPPPPVTATAGPSLSVRPSLPPSRGGDVMQAREGFGQPLTTMCGGECVVAVVIGQCKR